MVMENGLFGQADQEIIDEASIFFQRSDGFDAMERSIRFYEAEDRIRHERDCMDFYEIIASMVFESYAGKSGIPRPVDGSSQMFLRARSRTIEEKRQNAARVVGVRSDGISRAIPYEREIGREGDPSISEPIFDKRTEFVLKRLDPFRAVEAGDEFIPEHRLHKGEGV